MNLVIIVGPPASGKMTIGQELQKCTGYKLFYNHMSLELVNQFFDFGTPPFRQLDDQIRFSIFQAVADSEIDGLIFTMVWAFDEPEDEIYLDKIIKIFSQRNPKVCFVELVCDLEERLRRNKHENRLAHKPSKRDTAFSDQLLHNAERRHRMNSLPGEYAHKSILKIENTSLPATEVANMIIEKYNLEKLPST